jgi:carbon-monoxide dehydrogenase small subunit
MKRLIEIEVNQERYELAVEPRTTLLEVLRGQLNLTGAKEACGTGECGACTVLLEGRPVLACLALAVDCQGMKMTTVEGLADGDRLHPVQQAFQDLGAIQCGFCTPGMVLSTAALLDRTPRPDARRVKKALEGHLCRCTGYNKILAAVEAAGQVLGAAAPDSPSVNPAPRAGEKS